jgi:hypothetical protein
LVVSGSWFVVGGWWFVVGGSWSEQPEKCEAPVPGSFRLSRLNEPVEHPSNTIHTLLNSSMIRCGAEAESFRNFELHINLALRT